jgi:hypothetical protein
MLVYVLCSGCTRVFRLNYEPKNPDEWWCEACAGWAGGPIEIWRENRPL